jgi:hypothetical protein
LEPPSHNAWEPERGRRFCCIDEGSESQYLPDELEDAEKGTPQKVEDINEEPAAVLDMRISSSPPPSTPQYDAEKAGPDALQRRHREFDIRTGCRGSKETRTRTSSTRCSRQAMRTFFS